MGQSGGRSLTGMPLLPPLPLNRPCEQWRRQDLKVGGARVGGLEPVSLKADRTTAHDRTVRGARSRQLCGRATANNRPACSRQLSGLG